MLKDVKASVSYLSTASFWLAPCFYFVINLLPDHMGCFLAIDYLLGKLKYRKTKKVDTSSCFHVWHFFFFFFFAAWF